jgi:hypothetical protein
MIVAPWGERTLKSLKTIVIRYIFGHFKNLIRYVHSTSWQYYELWVDLQSLELGLLKFSKTIQQRMKILYVLYLDQLIHVTKY